MIANTSAIVAYKSEIKMVIHVTNMAAWTRESVSAHFVWFGSAIINRKIIEKKRITNQWQTLIQNF